MGMQFVIELNLCYFAKIESFKHTKWENFPENDGKREFGQKKIGRSAGAVD